LVEPLGLGKSFNTMDLSIIILNYNTKELTIECINSIVAQYKEELEKGIFEIILVDNASNDGSVESLSKLKTKIANFQLIESKENLGFSKGCNLGAGNAKGEYILFLNSDTEIKDQGLKKMVEYFKKNKQIGVLGGALKNEDGTSQSSAGKFYNLLNLTQMLMGFERVGFLRESPKEIKKVDWVSGACLMMRRKIFKIVGGFEKELFMYGEDTELCFRANKNGFPTFFYPEIMLFHKERGSSNRSFAIINIYKSILFFYKKYMPAWQYKIAGFLLHTKSFILNTVGILTGNKYLKDTYGQTLELFKT
jgi:GT2 family glycosyltransferase